MRDWRLLAGASREKVDGEYQFWCENLAGLTDSVVFVSNSDDGTSFGNSIECASQSDQMLQCTVYTRLGGRSTAEYKGDKKRSG